MQTTEDGVMSVKMVDSPGYPQRPHAGNRGGSIGGTSVKKIDDPG